jgi:hypothetical protein
VPEELKGVHIMKLKVTSVGFILFGVVIGSQLWSVTAKQAQQTTPQSQTGSADETKFVYADFERVENGRVVSNSGGLIQIFSRTGNNPGSVQGCAERITRRS